MNRKIVILTEGHSNPHAAKTACSVIRYRPDEVVAVLDRTEQGKEVAQLLDVGHGLQFIGSLEQAPQADTLLIGIAPPGGKIPSAWREIILEAIGRRMNVVSGLHDFLSEDEQFTAAARQFGVQLVDVRKNRERSIAERKGLREGCLRILTVGHDCSVGKMVTAIELTRGLKTAGRDAKFIATGQTGIMVEGDGCPIDCVVADFISGATERLILDNQHHEILVVEGQGSLVHPSYSGVTLGLLHGSFPHAMILCYEAGRTTVTGLPHVPIPPLGEIIKLNETMAGIHRPCPVIGISINGRFLSPREAQQERRQTAEQFGLPVCDVFRDGVGPLVEAVVQFAGKREDGSIDG